MISDAAGADDVLRATDEPAVRRCFPAYRVLRPHLDEEEFVRRWRAQAAAGFEVVFVERDGDVAAVMGFRELTTMAWGRILYVDDLVAMPEHRGQGLGALLLRHAQAQTVARGCAELHLDTGYARHDAHRTYLRNGFDMVCHHMSWTPPVPA
ncbi:GNAT family N-acetyltransferase [Quadrisphaera setariae]|uniref:GNAT family N-acetyltransferase n=1 Tax=Quadrisphaera setariae TaxID=2593304 RepID=A0A5C8ZEV1_9ACTN|nr:GNAT family N-acetyltransferase [Quadrisphaera setariae]TXR55446.1 GNAT family N-acetyltransferase [Quadrisphaera setariae]